MLGHFRVAATPGEATLVPKVFQVEHRLPLPAPTAVQVLLARFGRLLRMGAGVLVVPAMALVLVVLEVQAGNLLQAAAEAALAQLVVVQGVLAALALPSLNATTEER